MKCPKCGYEGLELFESKVLGLTITKIQDWDKPYKEIVIPEGYRMIKVWELLKLVESEECNNFLGKYSETYNYFLCAQTKYAKENSRSSWLYLNNNLNFDSVNGDLANYEEVGRVVFVKLEDEKYE